jgi:hypothetical protein
VAESGEFGRQRLQAEIFRDGLNQLISTYTYQRCATVPFTMATRIIPLYRVKLALPSKQYCGARLIGVRRNKVI